MRFYVEFFLVSLFLVFNSVSVFAIGESRLDFSTGYATAEFDWSIAGNLNGTSPNVLSELTWDKLNIWYYAFDGEYQFDNGWLLKGRYQGGEVVSGDNQDSDYLGNNRTLEFSRSNNETGGYTTDINLALGYRTLLFNDSHNLLISVAPYVGYFYNQQHLEVTNGYQSVSAFGFPVPVGPIAGLDSYFETRWRGPFVGFELAILGKKNTLAASFEYHKADYYGYGNWNLRSDFEQPKSFEHSADGRGIKAKLTFTRKINIFHNNPFELSLETGVEKWRTKSGIDQTNLADGRRLKTRLNETSWQSAFVGLGLRYSF